jgi:hypothetical protein
MFMSILLRYNNNSSLKMSAAANCAALNATLILAEIKKRSSEEPSYAPHIFAQENPINSQPTREPRDVVDICQKIIDIVPVSEATLLIQLLKFKDSLWNQAPELRKDATLWKPLGNILNQNIDSFDEEWQKKILKLFNDE